MILFGRRGTAYKMNLNMEVTYRVAIGTHVQPRRTERLRLNPTPLHSDADIDALVATLAEVWTRLALRRAA